MGDERHYEDDEKDQWVGELRIMKHRMRWSGERERGAQDGLGALHDVGPGWTGSTWFLELVWLSLLVFTHACCLGAVLVIRERLIQMVAMVVSYAQLPLNRRTVHQPDSPALETPSQGAYVRVRRSKDEAVVM